MKLSLDTDSDQVSVVCSALQNEVRLEIVDALADGPHSLDELYSERDISDHRSSIHRHLHVLRDAGLINKFLSQDDDKKKYDLAEEYVQMHLAASR